MVLVEGAYEVPAQEEPPQRASSAVGEATAGLASGLAHAPRTLAPLAG